MSLDDRARAGLPRRTLKIALPTLAALGAGGAIAVAAIPDASGKINACYNTNTGTTAGALRVVDTAQQCFENEKPIAWSEQGPQGQPGPQGPKGDQGNKGDQGDNATTPPATQVAHAFLKLTGVTGSSTDPQHKGQIDVRSFSWGLQTTGGNSGSGGGAGKSSFQDLHFTKNHDHASAALFKAAGSGQHYQSATFSVVQNGQETIRYKLIDVTVRSFATSDGFFAVNENVSLAPKQVQLTFHDNGADVTQSFAVGKKPLVGSFSFKSQSR